LKDLLSPYVKKDDRILNLGAGNSSKSYIILIGLCEELFVEGYLDITNIDFSQNIVTYMNEMNRGKGLPNNNIFGNILDMKMFDNEEFNFVIDKATLDCVLCGEGGVIESEKVLKEVHRILAPDGVFVCITYGNEDLRRPLFVKF
jgi:SAM-dependent methyltransferase